MLKSAFAKLIGAVALLLLLAPAASAASGGYTVVTSNGFSFRNFMFGALPSEYCPDVNSPCQNGAAEPAIRSDKFGNFYAASENGLTSGTEAWKSVDGGLHYVHLPSPNQISSPAPGSSESGISPAGGDVDVATATEKNQNGLYNIYVSSLGAAVYVSTSEDGGHTWRSNPLASIPSDDREWIAADGAQKVCISYITAAGIIVTGAGLHVQCSYDGGTTFTQLADAVALNNFDSRLGFKIGNLMIDTNSNTSDPNRNNDIVYQAYASGTVADALNPNPTDYHVVYMAVSTDGGRTFNDYVVYNNPDPTVGYGHQFVNVSVDKAGNVYCFYSDDHDLYMSYSRDRGQTWKGPYRVNKPPSNTAIFPWSAAGDAGKVDVVWYGTSYYGPEHPDNYPPTAQWYVYLAQNLNVFGNPTGFTQAQASPINHMGAVCEGGVGCTGNRDLYDDFGVAVNPKTGLASIVYSDDQYDQFNKNLTYPTSCTQAKNNTGVCDHTSIATQIAGPGIMSGGGVTPTCPPADQSASLQQSALSAINQARAAASLPLVQMDSTSSTAAHNHTCDQHQHGDPSHRGSDGSLPEDRMTTAGVPFTIVRENIGLEANANPAAALAAIQPRLLADADAKSILLNPAFKKVGIGVIYDEGVLWLTEDFSD